jgi:hypothetical protein
MIESWLSASALAIEAAPTMAAAEAIPAVFKKLRRLSLISFSEFIIPLLVLKSIHASLLINFPLSIDHMDS